METAKRIFFEKGLLLTGVIAMGVLCLLGWVGIADAPLVEVLNLGMVSQYEIDGSGRITDSAGRIRGWMKKAEIYGPDLNLQYRLTGKRLEDVN